MRWTAAYETPVVERALEGLREDCLGSPDSIVDLDAVQRVDGDAAHKHHCLLFSSALDDVGFSASSLQPRGEGKGIRRSSSRRYNALSDKQGAGCSADTLRGPAPSPAKEPWASDSFPCNVGFADAEP